MIISRTPFRISFFGGGTDYPYFYNEHGGATLLTTINQYCYISIHKLSPFFKHRFRASYAKTESVLKPQEFQHPLVRECLLHLGIKEGLEISHVADLPGRTGMGTSSSFTVGLLHALHAFRGDHVTAEDLAREAVHVERELVGDDGGHQDQYAAAYGGFLRLDFAAGPEITVKKLSLPADRLRALEERLMLFYTGVEQSSEIILREQKQRAPQNVAHLQEMKSLVDEAERVLENGRNLDDFGALLHHTWGLKKGLSTGISTPAMDQAYAAARRAGALGGKLLGAGGRGFLLMFVPLTMRHKVCDALNSYQPVPFSMADDGSRIIFKS